MCWDTIKNWFRRNKPELQPEIHGAHADAIVIDDPVVAEPKDSDPMAGVAHPIVEYVEPSVYFVESLGVIKGVYSDRDPSLIRGVVVHTTGGGLWRRWASDNPRIEVPEILPRYTQQRYTWPEWQDRKGHEPYPFDTALRVYATMMEAGPNQLVCGETGRVAFMCPLDKSAWHVGRDGRRVYEHGVDNDHWHARWPYRSPLSLIGSHEWDEANLITDGIEVAPPRSGYSDPWSKECHETLAWLIGTYLSKKCPNLDIRENTLLSHWDLHPNKRSLNSGLPWDPFDRQWLPAKKHILASVG